MHRCIFSCASLNGCATHFALRNDTVRTTDTLMDLQYQQILDNVARFHANPDTVPKVNDYIEVKGGDYEGFARVVQKENDSVVGPNVVLPASK